MKSIDDIKTLITTELGSDKYVIIYNGKIISNDYTDEEVKISLRAEMDLLYNKEISEYEKINDEKSLYSISIYLLKSMTLKIVNLGDKEKYVHKILSTKTKVKAQVCDIYLSFNAKTNIKNDFLVEDSSNIEYLSFMQGNSDDLTTIFNAYCYGDSKLNVKSLYMLKDIFRHFNTVVFLEENASVDMFNVIINNSNLSQNYEYDVIHKGANNTSKLRNYAIAKGESIINLNQNGKILKNAKKSDLNQKSRGLLLGKKSEISANPKLEIDENDVIASHGASIGALNDDDIFYLMSRGLTKKEAEELLINSYIEPFLQVVTNDNLREYFKTKIKEYL